MGQRLSCAGSSYDRDFFTAVQAGHLETVRSAVDEDPSLLRRTTVYDRLSALHIAAANGHVESLCFVLTNANLQSSWEHPFALGRSWREFGLPCAALLNPSAAEPLVWPSPLKFISELDPDAKALLEAALMEANEEREKKILKGTKYLVLSPANSDEAVDDDILVVAKTKAADEGDNAANSMLRRSRRSRNFSGGSGSFKGLTLAIGSFGRMGRGSGRIMDSDDTVDKP
ncbi:hypothetical protein BHE74_00056921 [Ensete ventricosum]|uniref:Uncharacterized protein n=1 Tax=Ensete ventricosum TaxID=4639 RepID=A0A426XFB6_ENSVE|nr:hypothetical protein B296_00054810 [Ensete ventricosum]RWW37899.1 hypothetical protein BHE74_00056921 [Ensete ventricosum]